MRIENRVVVSSWSLHSLVRRVAAGRPGDASARMMNDDGAAADLDLLDVPGALRAHGFDAMELCHFHVSRTDDAFLAQFRRELDANGIELWSLLVDDGDMSEPETGARDRDWIAGWVEVAGKLGATTVRVIAGKQAPTPENLQRAAANMATLVPLAVGANVRLHTENWFALLPTPREVHALLDMLNGAVGLCVDFGNWNRADKYDDIAAIAGRGTACHAKCNFKDGKADEADFVRCLEAMRAANYGGPFTLVAGESGDVWGSLATQRDIIVRGATA